MYLLIRRRFKNQMRKFKSTTKVCFYQTTTVYDLYDSVLTEKCVEVFIYCSISNNVMMETIHLSKAVNMIHIFVQGPPGKPGEQGEAGKPGPQVCTTRYFLSFHYCLEIFSLRSKSRSTCGQSTTNKIIYFQGMQGPPGINGANGPPGPVVSFQ